MSTKSETTSGSIGIVGLLGVVFITLKLCNVIDWSWWWVTLPFWGGIGLFLAILAVMGLVLGILTLVEKLGKR